MKNSILLVILMLPVSLFGQVRNELFEIFPSNLASYSYTPYIPISKDELKANQIKSLTRSYFYFDNKGKSTQKGSTSFEFDTVRNIRAIAYFNKNGDLKNKTVYSFDNNNRMTSQIKFDKNEKIISRYEYIYDPLGNLIFQRHFVKKKESFCQTMYYDSTKIKEAIFSKKGKFFQKWVYEYYDGGQMKATYLYDKNYKLKMTWSYDCVPEGEKIDKERDSINICRTEEHDTSGNILLVLQKTDEDGKIFRYINVMTPDSIYLEYKILDDKDKLRYHLIYYPNDKHQTKSVTYYAKNGKPERSYDYSYNDTGFVSEMISYHYSRRSIKKINWSNKYKYDDKNLVLENIYFDSKNLKSTQYSYSYEYF